LIIAVFIVLAVSACASEPGLGITEVMTAEQITAVGCDASASEGQIKHCVTTAVGCDPKNPTEKVKVCMEKKVTEFECGPIEKPANEIAACMVDYFQNGD
jgi:hypothetical protein